MITLSELQMKEVVLLASGKRLGNIVDLEINAETGYVEAIIIVDRQEKGSFFQKHMEKMIPWTQITTIGEDIILIKEENLKQVTTTEEKTE